MKKFELNRLSKFTRCQNFEFNLSECREQKNKSCGLNFNLLVNFVLPTSKVLLYKNFEIARKLIFIN